MSRSSKVNQVVLIIFDDIRSSHLFGLINQGKLPNMRDLVNNGILCRDCITSYPSITFPCYSNIMTGAYSGYFPIEGSGVPLYHWINRMDPPSTGKKPPFIRNYGDRKQLLKINRDIGKNVKTIFEQIPEENMLSSTSYLYRESYFALANNYFEVEPIFRNIEKAFKNPEIYFANKEVPLVSVGYVPHTDDLMHEKGFKHIDYINSIIDCDKYLGGLVNTLKITGYYDNTAIVIISDHGNFKAEKVIDLEPFFQQQGLIPYVPKKGIGNFDCNFGSVGFFNFKGETWHHHPTVQLMQNYKPSGIGKQDLNLFEILWKIPGAKIMFYREDDNKPEKGVIKFEFKEKISGRIMDGMIEYEGFGKDQKTKYIFNGNDFFGYSENEQSVKMLDNRFHSIEDWLEATYHIDFPMVIDQVPRYFKNPRSCDIIISTLGEFGFNYEHGKTMGNSPYMHDIALKKSMTVPLIIGGSPEIPEIELDYCKTTDIVPTLLNLLGKKAHNSVVGRSLLNSNK